MMTKQADTEGPVRQPYPARRDVALGATAFVLTATTAFAADVAERDVEIPTPDGKADAALFHPAGEGRWPAVLVWTDIMGLRPVFRQMGRRLAAEGYVVLVPNPYYRQRRAPVVEAGFDLSKPDDRAKLRPLADALTPDGTARDAAAFVDFLDAQAQTDTAKKAGVQGYCMGGAAAFRTAAARPGRIAAAGSFHGGKLVTDQPSSPHLLIPRTQASFHVAVADNDDGKEPDAKTALREAFAAAHRPAEVLVYQGADHGWCVPSSASYNEAAAEKAWAALGALYARTLV